MLMQGARHGMACENKAQRAAQRARRHVTRTAMQSKCKGRPCVPAQPTICMVCHVQHASIVIAYRCV